MDPQIAYLILAAGKGTRMHSPSPKVLKTVLGKPLLGYVYTYLQDQAQDLVFTIVGHGAEEISTIFPLQRKNFIYQKEQLGTGHAVQLAWPQMLESKITHVCVLNGDTPYVPLQEIKDLALYCAQNQAAMGILTSILDNPYGYGRILRDSDGNIQRIVEEKDFQKENKGQEIHEVNTGVYILDIAQCTPLLGSLNRNNQQNEYYLTQLVSLCAAQKYQVVGLAVKDSTLMRGINSPLELVSFENNLRQQIIRTHQHNGVIIRFEDHVVIGPDVVIEPGVEITGPCEIYGQTFLGATTSIASHCWIADSSLHACQIKSFSHIQCAQIKDKAVVGPFARLRPGTVIHDHAGIGNFVEVKNSIVHSGAKAGHLSYLGDAEIGSKANIGAGTITCNYDGVAKHKTWIGERAFIGSNTAIVAPIKIGEHAVVGAGSVVTKNVPESTLCVARAKQINLDRVKKKPNNGD